MADQDESPRPARVLRIYVSRERGLRDLPGDYESLEDAQYIFEKHHGEIPWCVIAEVEPVTEQPRFLAYGTATATGVEWKYVGIDEMDPPLSRGDGDPDPQT
jgi:hypothetical protein